MRIHFYGCSFTKGGGLHSKEYHSNFKKDWYPTGWEERIQDFLLHGQGFFMEYADYFNFPSHIGRKLEVEIVNHSIVSNNNDYIYEVCYESIKNNPNDLHFIQWTILSRRNFFYEYTKERLRLQGNVDLIHVFTQDGVDILNDPIYKTLSSFYKDYLIHTYDYTYESEKLVRLSDLLLSYNPNTFILSYEDIGFPTMENNRFILFDNLYLREYISLKKLSITDYSNGEFNDHHLSPYGHSIVGDYIISIINSKSPRFRKLI